MPRISDGGGGDTVVIDAGELRGLASTARGDIIDLDGIKSAVSGLIGGMDRRGWNAGAADGAWSSARGTLSNLSTGLGEQATSLTWLAGLVELFETGKLSGGVPYGAPMQDPVNSYTGNLSHIDVDLLLPTRGRIGLGLARTYNSRDAHRGLFGTGWTSNLEARVDALGDDLVIVTRSDGRRDLYTRHPDGSYVRPMGASSDLTRQPGGGWRVITPDGRWMAFSASGGLERLGDCNANVLVLSRDRNGRIVGLSDGVGRGLTLTYSADGRATSLADHTGRRVEYAYADNGSIESTATPGGSVMRYAYDPRGRLHRVTNGRGVTGLTVSYDEEGRVLTQTDALGGVSHFEYDGRETTLTDPRGGIARLTHDERGLLASIEDALGNATTFTYTACGNRETMRERNGGVWRYAYDTNCRPTHVEDPTGAVQVNVFDATGNIAAYVDATGALWRYAYDERRNLVAATDPLGAVTTYEVDEFGQTVRTTDADGISTAFAYNDAGQLVGTSSLEGEERREYDAVGNLVARIDPTGHARRWRYDADGRPTERIDGSHASTRLTCDEVGNVTSLTAPDGAVANYEYDAADRVVSVLDPEGGTSRFAYDANNNLTDITDPAGFRVRFIYDVLDRPTEFIDARGEVWRRSYDPRGDLTSTTDARGGRSVWERDLLGRIVAHTDRTGAATRFTYDAAGHLTSVVDPLERVTRYSYDAAGRPVAREDALGHRTGLEYTPGGRLAAHVDALGQRQEFAYDDAGRLARIEEPLGGSTTFAYDAAGRRVRETDRAGRETRWVYDDMGRLSERIDTSGGVVGWTYDAASQVVGVTDPLGRQTRYGYDRNGRLVSVTDPLGQVTRYQYDARGFLLERRDALERVSSYAYDANGWLTSQTDPLGRTTRCVLDGNGNWIERVEADGTRSTARYDAENRVIDTLSPDGAFVHLDYDAAGQRTRMLDGLGETRLGYDALGQLTDVVDAFEQRVSYAYDAAGRRKQVSYPDGRTVDYAYDQLDRLVQVADARYTYAAGSQPIGLEVPDRGSWRAERDAFDRVRRITYLTASQASVAEFTSEYDAVGNVVAASDNGTSASYTYDALNRLTAAGDERFTYDAVGNRVSSDGEVDAADQLVGLAHDGRGNPLEGPQGERYTWDAAGRLTSVELADGSRVDYGYDGRGGLRTERRRDVAGAESTRRLTLDLASLLPSVLAENGPEGTTEYIYGLGLIGAWDSLDVRDARGSVHGVVNEGSMRGYDAWGIPSGAPTGSFGFTGEVESADNLVYLRSRWYQPASGRLLGRDPDPGSIFDPLSQNPYAYARSNPLSLVDPSGMSASNPAFPMDPWNPFGPFGPFGPYSGSIPGAPADAPGEVPVWFRFTKAFGSMPSTYFGEYAKQQAKIIDDMFKKAGQSFTKATQYYQKSAAAFEKAVVPSEWALGRMPLFRDARRGWYTGAGESALTKGDDAMRTGKYLDDAARAMDDAKPWLRNAAKTLPFVSAGMDFGTSFYSTWQEDKGESTGTRIRHAATQGVSEAAGAYAGAVGGAAACTATGVGTVVAAGCAVVGGWVGGKVGGEVGKGANWVGDHVFGWLP